MSRNITSSASWQRYHRRADAVRTVLAQLDRTPSTELPWDERLGEVFLDPDDLLEALHAVWTRRLLGRVDVALELGSGSPRHAVEEAWRATRQDFPALRALLDRYAGTEVAARCVAAEHRLLAVAAGLAALSDPAPIAARTGAELAASLSAATAMPGSRRFPWLRPLRSSPTAVA